MRNIILLALAVAIILIPQPAYAQDKATISSSNYQLPNVKQAGFDTRVKVLTSYLKQYDSPLVPYAADFVETADKYNLDWRLVAAISGVESTFGKQIPYNSLRV